MSYGLPVLKYHFGALEPVLTAEMLEIHYSRHHAGYVNKLNDLLQSLGYVAPKDVDDLIAGIRYTSIPKEYRDVVRFYAGGHANHSFFWSILKPIRSDNNEMPCDLEAAINAEFRTVREFKELFVNAAMNHLGSGWAWLCFVPSDPGKLMITTTANHDNPRMVEFMGTAQFGIPLLTLDLWEHAYYLKYKNNKREYFDAFWKIVDWNEVWIRYQRALSSL